MAIIIEIGNARCVDHNKYDLNTEQAARELAEGRNVIAREYDDYGADDDEYSFPEVDTLLAIDYQGMSIVQIIESIRAYYESFGRAS